MIDYLRIVRVAGRAAAGERGASAVEYGLLITGIAAAIVAIVFLLGDNVGILYEETCDSVMRSRPADCSP